MRFYSATGPNPDLRTKLVFSLDDAGVAILGRTSWPAGVTVGPSSVGHHGDPSTIAVGAASVLDPTELEPYSSQGPSTYLYEPVSQNPDVYRFSGTSSAAPNAAAVALQYAGTTTSPATIRAALTASGHLINGPAGYTGTVDANWIGAGLIDATATLKALTPTPQPQPVTPAATGSGQLAATGTTPTPAPLLALLAIVLGGLALRPRPTRRNP